MRFFEDMTILQLEALEAELTHDLAISSQSECEREGYFRSTKHKSLLTERNAVREELERRVKAQDETIAIANINQSQLGEGDLDS